MLSIAHAATGAVLAVNLPSPYLSIPLILASHYALDAIAHHDAGTGLSSGKKTRQTAFILGLLDLLLAALVVLLLYPPTTLSFPALTTHLSHPAVWGAFIGLIPDFLEAPRNFLHYEPRWLKGINRFHASFHHSIPSIPAGIAPQALLLTLLYLWH